tara:strand:- start:9108 stop:9587 length:480 start_codon:yes stop_codon:yes gene_type:complete
MKEFFDFLPEILLFGSVFYFWGLALVVTIIMSIAEHNQSWTWVTIPFIGFLALSSFKGNLDIAQYMDFMNFVYYFGIGFLYALLKTAIFAKKTTRKDANWERDELQWRVFDWWILWPFSVISWIFSDLIKDLWEKVIYALFKSLFVGVFNFFLPKEKSK